MTNLLPTMQLFADAPGVDLIGLGGAYYPAYGATVLIAGTDQPDR